MPTTRSSSTSSTTPSTTSMASVLKSQLEASTSSMIYVPLDEGADTPTDDELKALAADGLHAEIDVVRGALAVRKATDDEIAEATAPAAAPESTTSSPSSSSV